MTLMTARTRRHVDQIVAVKRPLTIVALVTVIRRRHIVLLGDDICNLTSLLPLTNVVAFVAALTRMGAVAEYSLEYIP